MIALIVATVWLPLKRKLWCSWRHNWQGRYGTWARTVCAACDDRPPPDESFGDGSCCCGIAGCDWRGASRA